jgi:hypothetical protein
VAGKDQGVVQDNRPPPWERTDDLDRIKRIETVPF